MKTNSRFIIGFIAAAVTFGSLVAIAGPRCQTHHGYRHHYYQHHNNCNGHTNPQAPHADSAPKL